MEILVFRPGIGYISLGEGPITLADGDILLVSVTFHYTCNEDSRAKLRLSVEIGGESLSPAYWNDTDVDLEAAPSGSQKQAVLPILIKTTTALGLPYPPEPTLEAGTYDLKAEIIGHPDLYDLGIGMIVVYKKPGLIDSIGSIINMIVPMMMLMMIMPLMSSMSGGNNE